MKSLLPLLLLAAPLVAAPPPPVTALAYHPSGKFLLAGTYGEVAVIDPAKGEVTARLPGFTQRVTAIRFSNDGKLLAVASGEPGKAGAVQLFAVDAEGKITAKAPLAGHKDIVYALDFSPDGKSLASAGYDRVIRVTDTSGDKAPVLELKDHSDTVYGLAWHPGGALLASAGADRAVKVWDVASGKRLYTLGDPTDWVYAVAWHPEGKLLAAAGVDKSIRVWQADGEAGKLVTSVFAHTAPVTKLLYAADGKTLYSASEGKTVKRWDAAKMAEQVVFPPQPETVLSLALRPDGQQVAVGRFDGVLQLLDAAGKLVAEPLPEKPAPARSGQTVPLPATLVGQISRAGEADFFRFAAKANQEVGAHAAPATDKSKIEPVLELTDAGGAVLAEGTTLLGVKIPADGTYAIRVRDKEFRGGAEFAYRLRVGAIPIVSRLLPMGVPRGKATKVQLVGVNLPTREVTVDVPTTAAPEAKIPVVVPGMAEQPLGDLFVTAGEFTEVTAGPIPVPGTANGIIAKPGQADEWKFTAKKGQPLILEVTARRAGSGLDSYLEILDDAGKPRGRATLRCVARTFVTFRDHDSATPNIRLETWNELAMGDYVYVGNELLRVFNLPPGPDADCSFYSVNGQRAGQLDTTPGHHPNGAPLYKVELHPPGTTFPPNGLPVFQVPYRNDDTPTTGKDARLTFDPPADGEYRVRIGDSRGAGRPDFGYRLTVRPPKPDFTVSFTPTAPAVWKGGSVPVTVNITRLDGFNGPVTLKLEHLPPGIEAPPTFIEAGQVSATVALYAVPTATPPDPKGVPPMKLVATAEINGASVIREAAGGHPTLLEPGDLVTTTLVDTVTVTPGGEAKLRVKIERRNGFAGRVPLEVRGLPYGVRVLDIGLNGILITEKVTERDVVIYAEPWVTPMEMPFAVLAKREGKGTDHGAKSVTLKVAGK